MIESPGTPSTCYYNKDGRCMMMIAKGVIGAADTIQYCLGWAAACHRTKEQVENEQVEERIASRSW